MIDALISGRLIRDPVLKVGQSGKSYVNFLLSVPLDDGEENVLVSGIAFSDAAEKIGRLAKGDSVAVTGSLKPTTWNDKQTGEERHGLNVTVSACLSPYDLRKRRSPVRVQDDPKLRQQASGRRERAYAEDDGFDDDLAF